MCVRIRTLYVSHLSLSMDQFWLTMVTIFSILLYVNIYHSKYIGDMKRYSYTSDFLPWWNVSISVCSYFWNKASPRVKTVTIFRGRYHVQLYSQIKIYWWWPFTDSHTHHPLQIRMLPLALAASLPVHACILREKEGWLIGFHLLITW